jgi:hypothetical protein
MLHERLRQGAPGSKTRLAATSSALFLVIFTRTAGGEESVDQARAKTARTSFFNVCRGL